MTVEEVAKFLPAPPTLRNDSKALAMLDAIMCPDSAYRTFFYDRYWGPTSENASMRTGSGDSYSILFTVDGTVATAFDHESPMGPFSFEPPALWPGLLDGLPDSCRRHLDDPRLEIEGVLAASACLWSCGNEDGWRFGNIELPLGEHLNFPAGGDHDGCSWLFDHFSIDTQIAYRRLAEECYERPVDPRAIDAVFASRVLTEELVTVLNPDVAFTVLADDALEIGYPYQGTGSEAE